MWTYVSRQQLAKIDTKIMTIGEHFIESSISAKILGVTFDSDSDSSVDYCNSIFYGATESQTLSWEDCMQSVLNAAARLISNRRKFNQNTPVLREQLHWLPIRQRIDFKIAVFVYSALHGRGPTYLSRTCNPVREVGARALLRFALRGDLTQTRTRRFGPRIFRVFGPVVWNSLLEDSWIQELSLSVSNLWWNTHLFLQA